MTTKETPAATAGATKAKSPLHQMTLEHPTQFWNDGCEETTLRTAMEHGATGATSNPVLVLEAIDADPARWREVTAQLVRDHGNETEEQIAWRLVAKLAVNAAALLEPMFHASNGARGRLSLQVSPRLYPSAAAMVEQGVGFTKLAPNVAVKVPAVGGGIDAMEELTARGIVVNATVSFTVAQTVAVADAVERGLVRAKAAGIDTSGMTPWCTIMVGRLDDHLRDQAKDRGLSMDPEVIRQASTAVMREAYRVFRERGYRTTLLAAAMRSHHHWSEFIGGDVVVTIPPAWQTKFNAAGVDVRARMQEQVSPAVVESLLSNFHDFHRAFAVDGMTTPEFAQFGASKKTLHQFLGGYERLLSFVRHVMLPLDAETVPKGKA